MSNVDEIIKQMQDIVERNVPMEPSYWVEQAQRLVVLMGNESDKLHSLQKKVAEEKVGWIMQGKSVAEAKLRVEGSEVYEQMLNQKAKLERITETIRIAKIQARMRQDEFRGHSL